MIDFLGAEIVTDERLIVLIVAVCVGGIVRGFTGFGSALIIIPALTLAFDPLQAVVMHSIMEIPVVLGLAPTAVRHADRRIVLPMIALLCITTPIGAAILSTVNVDFLKIAISFAVLAMVCLLAVQDRVSALLGTRGTLVGAAAGGLIQGATGVGGPPIVTTLMARGDPPVTARGNVIAAMSSVIAISLVAFTAFGLITRETLVTGALAAPICLLATVGGMLAFRAFGGRHHRSVTLVVLVLTALETIFVVLSSS